MSGRNDRARGAGGRTGASRPIQRAGSPRHAASDDGGERVARVAERIRGELADMLLRGEIRDPAASGAIISAVTVTRDLSLARVFLRVLEAEPTDARRREVVAAFERARGHVRRELGARIARGMVAYVARSGTLVVMELSEPLKVKTPLSWRTTSVAVGVVDPEGLIDAISQARRPPGPGGNAPPPDEP